MRPSVLLALSLLGACAAPGARPATAASASRSMAEAADAIVQPCDSVARATARDSVAAVVHLRVRPFDSSAVDFPDDYYALIAQEIAQHFSAPSPLAVATYARYGRAGAGPGRAHPALEGMFGVTLRRDGRLRGARVLSSTLAATFDRSVLAAAAAADSAGALPLPPAPIDADSLELRLLVRTSASAPPPPDAVPLFRARLPVVELTNGPAPLAGNPTPLYPQVLRDGGITGEVIVQFVVDASGHPLPATVRVVRAADLGFVRAVLAVLPKHRFDPARVGRCAVPMLAQMPFQFSLSR